MVFAFYARASRPLLCGAWGGKRSEGGAPADTGESKAEEEDHGTGKMGTL